MPYVPNPTNAAEPLDSEAAGTAAAEFRALKGRVNTLAGTLASNARNKIINGKMEVAQRGTSFPAVVAAAYTLDRWRFSANASSAVLTASQQSDVPSSNEFQNSLRLAVTTADTSIASIDQVNIQQRIEGYNARDLIGKTFALSFWVRSTKTGTHCVYFQNSAQDRTFVLEYTVSASNTWEYKTVTVSGGLITAGTWDWTTGVGLIVGWTLAAGSSLQTTANAWQTGNFFATSNQVNCLDSASNIFAITGVQLEVGSVATPFDHRPIGAEELLCKRYTHVMQWQDFYLAGQAPSNGTTVGNAISFPTPMRATPTVTSTLAFNYLGTVSNAAVNASSNNVYRQQAIAGGQYVVTGTSGTAIFTAEL
jgi:hypothetical protein